MPRRHPSSPIDRGARIYRECSGTVPSDACWDEWNDWPIYRIRMNDPAVFRLGSLTVPAAYSKTGIPFSNGQTFSSGSGFAFDPFVLTAQAAVAGAEAVIIDVQDSEYMPVVGQIMSHCDWPFGVVAVTQETETLVRLGIQMPLRRSIDVGEPILLQGTGLCADSVLCKVWP